MPHICSVLPNIFCEGSVGVANSTFLHGQFPLTMDQAYLTFVSTVEIPLDIYENHDMCEDCNPAWRGSIKPQKNFTYIVGTETTRTLTLKHKDKIACRRMQYFSEYGDYYMDVKNVSGKMQCSKAKLLQTVPYAVNQWYLPLDLILIFVFLLIFAAIPTIIKFLLIFILAIKKFIFPSKQEKTETKPQDYSKTDKVHKPHERLISLDVFRGGNVILMIFGNAGAAQHPYFYHNVWHGMNISELPHGWFNWMLGISYCILTSGTWRNKSVYEKFRTGFIRTAALFFLGLVVNSVLFSKDLERIPYCGVLQGMGVLYLFILSMDLIIPRKKRFLKNRFLNFLDFGTLWPYYLIIFTATVIQNAIMFGLDVPGCGRGYLGPGGEHMHAKYKNCTGGAVGYLDRMIVGSTRMPYPLPFHWFYKTSIRFDPYCPIGLIGQLVQVYLGVIAGEIFLLHRVNPNEIFKRWLCLAAILTFISWLLCNITFGYCILPCNRRLWTLTHSCNVGMSALFVFTVLYFVIDLKKIWNGWPMYYLGRNSLFVYVGHILTKESFPFTWPTPRRHMHLFVQHWGHAFWWLLICGVLYHKKYFFTA